MNIFLCFLLFLSLFFQSCSGKFRRNNPEEQKDLVEEFNIEKEQVEKFKVTEENTQEEKIESNIKKEAISQNLIPLKTKKKNKQMQGIANNEKIKDRQIGSQFPKSEVIDIPSIEEKVEKKIIIKIDEDEIKQVKEETITYQRDVYPLDFPRELKDYDTKSKKVWEMFKPVIFPGEILKFKIKYFGVVCGHITLETLPNAKIGDNETYHFRGKMKSAPFYKYLYTLNDYIETFVDAKKFVPLKYVLVQRESGQIVDDLELFDFEKLKTFFWFKRIKNGEEAKENKSASIPYWIQDSFSVLYFVRGLPLQRGDYYEFPIITRAKLWLLKAWVMGPEKIEVDGKEVYAIKIKAETQFPGILKKKGDILFWYSVDPSHKLLKFSAKVKIGAVEGEITENFPEEI